MGWAWSWSWVSDTRSETYTKVLPAISLQLMDYQQKIWMLFSGVLILFDIFKKGKCIFNKTYINTCYTLLKHIHISGLLLSIISC